MEITWGFLLLFSVFVFPGLIIRRLYFFGEFSKQFGYNDPLLKTLAYALVPGLLNAILTILVYDSFFGDVNLGKVFDAYKNMADKDYRNSSTPGTTVDEHFRNEVLPFLGLLYMQAVIIGALLGQAIRWTAIDTKLKIFRFKNQWFYLFTGNHRKFRKYQAHVKDTNRFLFLIVDVMVESGGENKLYTGTLVDYELDPDDCRELSKLILSGAHRYTKDSAGKIERKLIPGNLFVLDCTKLVNLNLTHVYESDEQRYRRTQDRRRSVINWMVVLTILILPLAFFRIDAVQWACYDQLMGMTWLGKLFAWVVVSQIIQIPNPIVVDRKTNEYRYATVREWLLKLGVLPALYYLAIGVDNLAKWFLSLFA